MSKFLFKWFGRDLSVLAFILASAIGLVAVILFCSATGETPWGVLG